MDVFRFAPTNQYRRKKVKTRIGSLLLAAVLLMSTAGFTWPSKLPVVQPLSTTVPVYDPMAGISMGISGLFERTIAGTDRTAKLYVPQGAHLGAYMVVTNVPDGEETVRWLADSGWIKLADREKFLLYVFEPGLSGSWGTAEQEQVYIETAYGNISLNSSEGRGTWYLPPESYYVVGYDTAGSVLQKMVMKDPTLVAAAAFVNASDIGGDFLASLDSNYYPTPDRNGNLVASSNVPLPVWIISKDLSQNTSHVIDYWKEANQTGNRSTGFQGGKIYYQKHGTLHGYVADSSRTAVAVREKKNLRNDTVSSEKIYEDFLSLYTRYGGNVGGNTVGSRPDYQKLGVQFKTLVLDGRLREYMVYVPRKAKEAARRGEDVPAVFSLHGSGMTMYAMFDYSRWWEVADDEGFILVVPTGLNTTNRTGWNTSDTSIDMSYIQLLLDEVKAEYNVDASRIYLGGQSNGSMMTQAIGRNLALSKNFAALGSTSGGGTSTDYSGEVLPFFLLFGEFDFWPYQLSTPTVGNSMTYWINRNDALGTATTPASEETNGRYLIYKWNNADGVNVVRYGVTKGRGHSIIPEEMRLLWNWYELWKKAPDGSSAYVGR
ncbi:PHB depolymerase family esterase [Nonomuraea sp. MTCD27]|uniref:alpha/beta hydrolase family esterase n=1 Tax=Nonomuraea sp. MTCD27 TaxID=1676747 RepID=UPI0035C1F74F